MQELIEETVESEQYLTFTAGGESYAIQIMRMREIVPYRDSTKVPLAPDVLRGLVNLRGRAIPVIDLSVRFGGPETPVSRTTCVLIVDIDESQDRPEMGILADSVSRVIDVDRSSLEESPNLGMGPAAGFLDGMVKWEDGFIPIIDIEEVLRFDASLQGVLPESEETPDIDAG